MEDIEVLRQRGQRFPQDGIDGLGTQRAAHHHEDGTGAVKTGKGKTAFPRAGEDLGAQRGSGVYAFFTEALCTLREGGADASGKRLAQFVGQAWRDVGFVHDHGDFAHPGTVDYGHADKPALGKHDIGIIVSPYF